MSVKALFHKEWKQSKVVLMLISLIFVFVYPMRALLGLQDWRERANEEYFMPAYEVPNVFGPSIPGFLIIIFLVLLAVQLIGMERNTRRHDFAFALPFKRRTMFLVKWVMGVATLTLVMTLTFLISYLLISTSEFSLYMAEHSYLLLFLGPWLGYVVMYSFALFIGTIAGEMVSQIALTFIFTIFPIGIIALIGNFTDLHFNQYVDYPEWLLQFVWPLYVLTGSYQPELSLWVPALATIVFLILGQWLYERNYSEYNGEFLIFKKMEPVFLVGIIVCFAMLGGMIVSGFVPWGASQTIKLAFYWIGIGIFSVLSYFLTKKLFSMNIKVKGK